MFKGAIHVHSTYSDGELSLPELRQSFLSVGCAFVVMTDHAEWFDQEHVLSYIHECELLSDDQFLFVPSLEYECEQRLHILGLGTVELSQTDDPEEVITSIARQGGISVIAHPPDAMFDRIAGFQVLPDGIETWNTKYDGRYAARPATFHLLTRLQERKLEMRGFYGQDLHWRKQCRDLFTMVNCPELTRAEIMSALRRGDFYGVKAGLELPSDGHLSSDLVRRFEVLHHRSGRIRSIVRHATAVFKYLGIPIPFPLKSEMRRLF